MRPYLHNVIALSDGLYEAIHRDYVQNNLFGKITMDGYVKHVLRFSFNNKGELFRNNDYVTHENFQVIDGINRIARDVLLGLKGLQYIEIGLQEIVVDTLHFHVFDVYFDERVGKWQ